MRFILFSLLFCCFCSCQGHGPEKRSQELAKSICGCTEQLLEMNKQAAKAGGNINFESIQTAFETAKSCVGKQKIKPEELPEIEQALTVLCPQLASEKELLQELMGN